MQPFARGDNDLHLGRARQERNHGCNGLCARRQQMLKIVQNQQHLFWTHRLQQAMQRIVALWPEADLGGDGGHQFSDIGDGGQWHKKDAVGKTH